MTIHQALFAVGSSAPATYPIFLSNTVTNVTSSSTTHNIAMPAIVVAGDLLLAFVAARDDNLTTPAGWTLLGKRSAGASTTTGSVFYKVAAGTEGGTTVNFATATSSLMSAQVVRIQSGTYSSTPETANTFATSGTTPDPPSLSPSWGSYNVLLFAFVSTNNSRTISVYPLPDNQQLAATGAPGVGGTHQTTGLCTQQATGSTFNPGTFTINVSSFWTAHTIALKGA